MCGKGDKRRPTLVSQEEATLRWDLALGKISRMEFDQRLVEIRTRIDSEPRSTKIRTKGWVNKKTS